MKKLFWKVFEKNVYFGKMFVKCLLKMFVKMGLK